MTTVTLWLFIATFGSGDGNYVSPLYPTEARCQWERTVYIERMNRLRLPTGFSVLICEPRTVAQ